MSHDNTKILATISGSFHKHLDEIQRTIREFQREGIEVLSPELSELASSKNGFVMLETDKGSPGEIETRHLEAISRSDFLYIVNPEGYLGKSAALEIGFAISRNIPVYSLSEPDDVAFSSLVRSEKPIRTIKRDLKARTLTKKPPTLAGLQDYVRKVVKLRGFEDETVEDGLLLFVEEIGELARAVRIFVGLKSSRRKRSNIYQHLREELADCLIYLIDIANLADIDLENAVRKKEMHDLARRWH